MWIHVRRRDGSQGFTIDNVTRRTTIEELRERVRELFEVYPQCQRLYHQGQLLEDGYTLFDYDVVDDDNIELLDCSDVDDGSISTSIRINSQKWSVRLKL